MVAGFPQKSKSVQDRNCSVLCPGLDFCSILLDTQASPSPRGRRPTQGHELQEAGLIGYHLGGIYMFPEHLEWHVAQHEHSVN